MGVDTWRVVREELVEGLLRDLVCVICRDLIDPHDALQAPCSHAFCGSCILQALEAGHRCCPLDKRSLARGDLRTLKDANPLVFRMLGRTEVRCINLGLGCHWVGELLDCPLHLQRCHPLPQPQPQPGLVACPQAAVQQPAPSALIKVVRDGDLRGQIGSTVFFDLADWNTQQCHSFQVPLSWRFTQFKEEVERVLGVPVECQRFWTWVQRENRTFRPCRPLNRMEEATFTLSRLMGACGARDSPDLKLFLEGSPCIFPAMAAPLPMRSRDSILLFCKLYNPYTEELRYVGSLYVKRDKNPQEYKEQLCSMAGFSPLEDLVLFEEIKHEPLLCEPVDLGVSFRGARLGDGDIICYQRATPALPGAASHASPGEAHPSAVSASEDVWREALGAMSRDALARGEALPVFVPPRHKDVPAFFQYLLACQG